jgi:hypothetical protein
MSRERMRHVQQMHALLHSHGSMQSSVVYSCSLPPPTVHGATYSRSTTHTTAARCDT